MDCTKIIEDVISGAIVVLFGAVVAAWLAASYSRKQQKLQITLSVIDQYFSIYEQISEVKPLLTPPNIVQALQESNPLRRTGDWLNGVADMINSKTIDISLCNNVGILKEIKSFHDCVSTAMEECIVDSEDMERLNKEWKTWWKNLVTFSANIDEGRI